MGSSRASASESETGMFHVKQFYNYSKDGSSRKACRSRGASLSLPLFAGFLVKACLRNVSRETFLDKF